MKKLLTLVLTVSLTLSMAACGSSGKAPSDVTSGTPIASGDTAEIAMITDMGTIDDKSYNQGTWEGVKIYAEKNGKTYKYYKPAEKSDDAFLSAIELAVKGGAKVIVMPGFFFESAIFQAQIIYPDVNFILIDGYPNNGEEGDAYVQKTEQNTVGIGYAEEQSGFLAGYASVKEGYTKLGFMGGMALPAVVGYGYGFIQGADAAAKELNIPEIQVNYHYTGNFKAFPEAQTLAATWYHNGTEVIFSCGGAVGNSVMAAAAANNPVGKVIGVDVDQAAESPTVMTSAMKNLGQVVIDTLDQYYNGKFPGGQSLLLDAAGNGVKLPMETSTFTKFSQADYDAVYAKLSSGELKPLKDTNEAGDPIGVLEIPVTNVKIIEVK